MALVYSFFTTFWKKYRAGSLHPKNYEFGKEEVVLSATTLLVFLAIYFPYMRGIAPGGIGLTYEGQGVVVEVDHDEKKITLNQDEVRDLMPAITMEYDVESPGALTGLRSGDRVRFKLSPKGVEFIVMEIWKEKGP